MTSPALKAAYLAQLSEHLTTCPHKLEMLTDYCAMSVTVQHGLTGETIFRLTGEELSSRSWCFLCLEDAELKELASTKVNLRGATPLINRSGKGVSFCDPSPT